MLCYVPFHYVILYYVILRNITLHNVALQYAMLRYVTLLHVTIQHYVTLSYFTYRVTSYSVTSHCYTLRHIKSRCVTFQATRTRSPCSVTSSKPKRLSWTVGPSCSGRSARRRPRASTGRRSCPPRKPPRTTRRFESRPVQFF